MIVKLLTEHHLEFLSLKGGCRGSSESTLVKMSNCWKSHVAAQNFIMETDNDTGVLAVFQYLARETDNVESALKAQDISQVVQYFIGNLNCSRSWVIQMNLGTLLSYYLRQDVALRF